MKERKKISEMIRPGYPRYYLNNTDRPTFVGVLESNFDKRNGYNFFISDGWNSVRTYNDAIGDYCNSILPKIHDRDKALDSYEERDFLGMLDELETEKGFEERRRGRLKLLLWKVYQAAIENIPGFIPKFRWDKDEKSLNSYKEDFSDATDESVRLMMIPKSFTLEQELHILKLFRDEDITTMEGVRLGIYLMFFLGLRNEECVGASWDDIISPFKEYPEKKAIVVHTSFKGGELRTSMKTKNAYRIIPLIPYLADMLEIRKNYVFERLSNIGGELIPIVCAGEKYKERANTESLTYYGREFIRKEIGEPSKLSALSEMIKMLENQKVQIGEKEATTYLTRRAFATHLRNLGLETEEIEFLMGHSIEDESIKRHHMATADSLMHLFETFERHPFNAFFDVPTNDNTCTEGKDAEYPKKTHRFVVEANEPCDPMVVNIPEEATCVKMVCSTVTPDYGNYVDISCIVNQQYKRKEGTPD